MKYRDHKKFCKEEFLNDLEIGLRQILLAEYSALVAVLTGLLKKHAALKKRIIRGNNKQHFNMDLRKAVMLRASLKKRAQRSGSTEDFEKNKKQQNLIVKINRKAKFDFFSPIEPRSIGNGKKLWKMVKPMFSNSNQMGEKINLIEEGVIIWDDAMIAECFNSHFINITVSLELDPMFKQVPNYIELDVKVSLALAKCNSHPSIITTIQNVNITHKF